MVQENSLARGCLVLFGSALLSAPPWCLAAQENADLKERFFKEASSQSDKYRIRASRLKGSWVWTRTGGPLNSPKVSERKYELKQRQDGSALLLEETFKEENRETSHGWLRVTNPAYAFELYRESPESSWAIARYSTKLKWPTYTSPSEWANFVSSFPYTVPDALMGGTVIAKDAGFALKQITPVIGTELARVEFDYRSEDKNRLLQGGWLLLDPQHYWVIREYALRVEYPGQSITEDSAGNLTYAFGGDGFPVVKTVVRTRKNKLAESESRFDFDLVESDVPEKDFTLSAFGFPEPPSGDNRPKRWFLWSLVGAVVCLVLFVAFRRIGKRV